MTYRELIIELLQRPVFLNNPVKIRDENGNVYTQIFDKEAIKLGCDNNHQLVIDVKAT